MSKILMLLLLALFLMLGCSIETVPTRTSQMAPLLVDKDKNPDVIWVVRQVQVQGDYEMKTFWGLFACY
ncbi:hypothetical protein KAH37_07415, partial [bacterium]|nr:hypothetical protein [bacterium]